MDNFDLKKYLVENKVTTNSRMLNEDMEKSIKAEIAAAAEIYKDGKDDVDEKHAMMLGAEDVHDKYRQAGDEDKAELAKSIMRSYESKP